jgi:hypothetical protein
MKFHRHLISRPFPLNDQNVIPIFSLGSGFQLQFDDLYGMKRISIMKLYIATTIGNHLKSLNEYLLGFDNQRIQNYTNSFNTLQLYPLY